MACVQHYALQYVVDKAILEPISIEIRTSGMKKTNEHVGDWVWGMN